MRVLITGATGFAGRHLVSLCSAQGSTEIIGIGRRPGAEADPPAELAAYHAIDLSEPGEANRVVGSTSPEMVFHLAAEASVANSWADPANVINYNVSSTLNLLEAVRTLAPGARVLVACSGEEYGAPEQLPVTEEHPLRPKNPYAVSKASVDIAAGFYADAYGLRIVRTRAFNHAGPGQFDNYVMSNFARQIAEGEASGDSDGSVEVVTGNPDIRRDFTDVRDVVRAYWLAVERAEPGAYNVCSSRSVAIAEILSGLARHTELEVRTRTDPKRFRQNEVMEIRGSHDKLTRATGWEPEIPLDQTLHDMLEWWRSRTRAGVAS
jgi:GDP-4-dehydro-6-deoxy-D-mannose reductase